MHSQSQETGKQTSSVNDVIHYECMLDILVIVLIELSRYGKFPEFFRKNSGKFPTFYFPEKLQPYLRQSFGPF